MDVIASNLQFSFILYGRVWVYVQRFMFYVINFHLPKNPEVFLHCVTEKISLSDKSNVKPEEL